MKNPSRPTSAGLPRHVSHRRRAALGALGALALMPAALALAQPADRQVRLIVGFPPGSGPDIVARTLGQRLGEVLRQTLVVDNRAGAGGQIAAQAVAKSPPDGTTLLLGEVGSISIAPAAYPKLPYDPAKELAPIAEVVRSDFVLVVPAASPAKTLAEFVAAAKAKRDRANFGTFGAGTPGHFGADVFGEQAGFGVEPIHYRSTGDAVNAIAAGDVQAAFISTALAVAQLKGGRMRALATTAPQRLALLPDVPTFAESGFPKVDFSAWFAVLAPTGTPPATLDAMQRAIAASLQTPDVAKRLADAGFTVVGGTRADAERLLRAESQRWAAVVKATGFKGE